MLSCTFFVFSTLWHFTLVCVIARRPWKGASGGMSPTARPSASMCSAMHLQATTGGPDHHTSSVGRFPYRKSTLMNGGASDAQLHELTRLNPHGGASSSPDFHHGSHYKDRSDSAVSDPIWILVRDCSFLLLLSTKCPDVGGVAY